MNDVLFCCIAEDASECKDAAPELLSALGYDFSSWKDEETKRVHHTMYFPTKDGAIQAEERLKSMTDTLSDMGINFSSFRQAELKKEDWAESWKIHFKTMVLSPRLAVKPSWEKYEPLPGQKVMVLDPGMSFGTGQHATTKFCLKSIDTYVLEKSPERLTFLDAGSGSGILAIAAYLLGCKDVHAFDVDKDTIPVAEENAERNGIKKGEIDFKAAPLLEYENDRQFDVVAANILSSALIAGRKKLLSMVKPHGRLILAGILDSEYESVRAKFEELGCVQTDTAVEKEWRGGAFIVP